MLREWSLDGHRIIELASRALVVRIDVTRGAHIFHLEHLKRPGNILYQDPRGVAEHEVGGWFELFPNAGAASEHPPAPQHGDVRDLAWTLVAVEDASDGARAVLTVRSRSVPVVLEREISLEGERLAVTTRLRNEGAGTVPYLWGSHLTFGSAILRDDLVVDLPAREIFTGEPFAGPHTRVAPGSGALDRLPGRAGGSIDGRRLGSLPAPASEMLFARGAEGHATLRTHDHGVTISWDPEAFPAAWLWLENRATQAEPFFGEVVAIAIEPQSSTTPGLEDAIRDGSARALVPGSEASGWIAVVVRTQGDDGHAETL